MAQAKGVRLKLAPTQAFVCSDRGLLQSILQNFLSNAVRYTSQGGVLVGARVRGDQIRLEVWDTGPGVPAEKRRAIFEEFRRLDGATDADGVGLGLAIVERTARILGAHVGLRSVVGKGSVFSIEAPRAQAPGKRDVPREATAGELFDLRGVRVLVLDDEPEIVEAMDALLTGWGCVVETARTSRAALALARGARFDCAVVDVRLGGAMSGLQVAAALKRAIPGIGLVLATAERGEMVARMAQALGAEVLHKPVDSARLRRFLALRRATQPVA
jgi:CheY-like chemotaxis protein/anti-sigma regulatory factor (Ser/Thr protein kinase)